MTTARQQMTLQDNRKNITEVQAILRSPVPNYFLLAVVTRPLDGPTPLSYDTPWLHTSAHIAHIR